MGHLTLTGARTSAWLYQHTIDGIRPDNHHAPSQKIALWSSTWSEASMIGSRQIGHTSKLLWSCTWTTLSASPLLWLAGAVASATQECDTAVTLTGVPGNAEGPFFPVDLGILWSLCRSSVSIAIALVFNQTSNFNL